MRRIRVRKQIASFIRMNKKLKSKLCKTNSKKAINAVDSIISENKSKKIKVNYNNL